MEFSISLAASGQPRKSNIITPGKNDGAGIDYVFVGVFRGCSMGSLKDGEAVANVGSGSDAESADLSGAGVGNVIAVEVGSRKNAIFLRSDDHLLEDGIGDAVVDQQLLFPLAVAVRVPMESMTPWTSA